MDFGGRRLLVLVDRRSYSVQPPARQGHIHDELAGVKVVIGGLGQIQFPDTEERFFILLILRYQTCAKCESCNKHP